MKIENYFYLDESATNPGCFLIKPDLNKFNNCSITEKGSFSILAARVMNLSFAQYLRMCRDIFHGEIVGKNTLYPVVYYKTPEAQHGAKLLIKTLNAQMTNIMIEKNSKYSVEELKQMIDILEKRR